MTTQLNNLNYIERDITTEYFNNLYKPQFTISADLNSAIVNYFEKISATKEAAKALAGAVIYTAKAQNLDPMEVLQKFASMPLGQLSGYLTMFLNLNRMPTSMLGISNAPVPNKYVSRAILP